VKENGRWLKETGFTEIAKAARATAMPCAENEKDVRRWLKTLPAAGRPQQHPEVVWRNFYLATKAAQGSRPGWRTRMRIDEATALRARDDVVMACHDVVRRGGYDIADDVVDVIANAAFVATLNALDVAVPERFLRKVTFTVAGQRVTVLKIASGKLAATA
jgi:hypothetical protein